MDIVKIKVAKVGGETLPTVNARELHASLGITKDFSTWVKSQIKRARLVENIDFIKLTQKGELSATGQTVIDYHLTLESAKHIAMMSGSEKGVEVRGYFLKCEKELRLAEAKKLEQARNATKKVAAPTNKSAQILDDFDAIPCRPLVAQPGNWEEESYWLAKTNVEVGQRQIWHAQVAYLKQVRAIGFVVGLADYERLLNLSGQPLKTGQREKMGAMVQDRMSFVMKQMTNEIPLSADLASIWYCGKHEEFKNEVTTRLQHWARSKELM